MRRVVFSLVLTLLLVWCTLAHAQGVQWQPVPQYTVMSIHDMHQMEPHTLHLTHVRHRNSRQRCGGNSAGLLMITNHGIPVRNIFAPAGQPTGFVEVYFDQNGDGTPDGSVWALDLSTQDDVWVTWRPGDDLQFVYLRSERRIAVGGILYPVYRATTRQDADVIACRRDSLARPGGHQRIPIYSLERVRY